MFTVFNTIFFSFFFTSVTTFPCFTFISLILSLLLFLCLPFHTVTVAVCPQALWVCEFEEWVFVSEIEKKKDSGLNGPWCCKTLQCIHINSVVAQALSATAWGTPRTPSFHIKRFYSLKHVMQLFNVKITALENTFDGTLAYPISN